MIPAPSSQSAAFIVGFGNIGRQVATLWQARSGKVAALVRTSRNMAGCQAIYANLDYPDTLQNLPSAGAILFHFAPPFPADSADTRTAHLLKALEKALPQRIIYFSTSSVYGDCQGVWVDET